MLLTALLVAAAAVAADEGALVNHPGPMAKAMEDAKAGGKTILLDFYTDW